MDDNYTIPQGLPKKNDPDYTIPISKEVQSQAFSIAKGLGLALIKPRFYRIDVDRVAREQLGEEIGATSNGQDFEPEYGLLNLPVFDTLTFDKFSYQDNAGNTITLPTINLQTALFDVSRPKNIIETKIQGRDKDVNEYINGGNYYISIKGQLVGLDANKPPAELKKRLIALSDAPVEIPVSCNFLNDFGIYSIIIRDITWKQTEGTRNVIYFEMDCKDEVPFEIKSNA